MVLKPGDKVRRNPDYLGPDHGYKRERGNKYYTEEGIVASVDKIGAPFVNWGYDSFKYPGWTLSLVKVIVAKDMSLPDNLFEL